MSTTASISDVQSTEVSPGALSATAHSLNPAAAGLDDVTLLVAAAEAFARRSIRELPGVGLGGRVRDEFICMECQRGSRASGVIEHSTRCDVGKILTLCVGMRGGPGMSLAQAEFARGVAHGEARQLARQIEAIAVPPSEQASAVRTLELVTGTGITLTPERAAQIQREFENAARQPEGERRDVTAATHFVLPTAPNSFVKTAQYFVEQGGLTAPWGRAWIGIVADDIDSARAQADRMVKSGQVMDARLPERRVVCGRAIAVFGYPDKDVFTCDLPVGHGDCWHEDHGVGFRWVQEATELRFQREWRIEMRRIGSDSVFSRIPIGAEVAR